MNREGSEFSCINSENRTYISGTKKVEAGLCQEKSSVTAMEAA